MREIRRRRRRRSRRDRQTEESREVSESLPHTEAVTPQHARYRHRCVHKPFVTELLFAHLGHFLSCSTPRSPLQCVSCISLQYSLSHLPPLHLFCPPEYPPARSFAQIPVAGSIIQPRPVRVWSSARVANVSLALPPSTSWLSFLFAFSSSLSPVQDLIVVLLHLPDLSRPFRPCLPCVRHRDLPTIFTAYHFRPRLFDSELTAYLGHPTRNSVS